MAMVLDVFVSEFVQLLVSYGKDRIALILGVSEEIKKLRRKFDLIQSVLADAELRQLQGDEHVRHWLDELKDIMYDAEDIIEEYKAEAEKYIEEGSESSSSVRCCSPLKLFWQTKSKNEIAEKIKDLNRRLDDTNKEKEAFGLVQIPTKETKQRRISQTTSPLEEPDIVGSAIEDATRHLVELLTQENNNKKNILIYAIVGMGGIGKTTLAQKICNDDILLTSFHPMKPTWVCISKDNVDEINILKSIISGVGGGDSRNINERGQLQLKLYESVKGKRVFLVLDDVWDAQVWEDLLRIPLCEAGAGSRVLLTTRDDRLAKQVGVEYQHNMPKLSVEDGWSLLCKKVFRDSEEEEMHEFLKETGIEIVKKCDGLPVAINAVAGVLRTKDLTKSEWDKVLLSPMWLLTSVQQAFYLSYEDLPSHLKQCFLYLSLFPEDSNLEKDDITHLWIAEGFVKTKDNYMLEETADDYWKELIQRNLLQVITPAILTCKMHDLLRSFAQDLAQNECCCGDVQVLDEIVSKTRKKARRWFVHGVDQFSFDVIYEHTSLRTFIRYEDIRDKDSIQSLDDSFRLLKRLRILKLGFLKLKRLPSSFADLKYLRYLDLSGSEITELPENIKSLRNLQFLYLYYCCNLQSLPKAIGILTSLRYLDIRETRIDKMPKEMVKLRQLRTLRGFKISSSRSEGGTWCTLEDVKHFKELKELELYKLKRTSGAEEAREAALAEKTHLTRLRLIYNEWKEANDEETSRRTEETFEELRPPTCIEELYIDGYYSRTFPSWLMRPSSLMNLRILNLRRCRQCEELPPLGQLPQLAELILRGVGLRRIVLEFLLTGDTFQRSFAKLEKLSFHYLNNWEEWEDWAEEKEDQNLQKKIVLFPRLKKLKIKWCPKLRYLPHLLLNRATALTELIIDHADELEAVENLHHIKTLKITFCRNLKRVTNLSSLKTLDFKFCNNLQDMEHLPELQLLTIYETSIESLPVPEHLPKLQKLSISRDKVSLLLRCRMDGEEWPKIRDIPHFEFHSFYGLFINYTKSPFSYETNISSVEPKDEGLPEQVNNSSLHQHPLTFLPSIAYRCRKCGEEGEGWSFRCKDCGYDLHPKCALPELEENNSVAQGEADSDIQEQQES